MTTNPVNKPNNRSFTDLAGRTWHVQIGVTTVRRVKALTNVDLLSASAELLQQLATDVELLVNVLYAALQPQATQQGVSDVDFGEQLGGQALDDATLAFVEALIDFFPQHLREVLKKAWEKTTTAKNQLFASTMANVESSTLNQIIADELAALQMTTELALRTQAEQAQQTRNQAFNSLYGISPASPDSTHSVATVTA